MINARAEIVDRVVDCEACLTDGIITGSADLITPVARSRYPEYDGPVFFTPTEEAQTIEVGQKETAENIIIAPIPNNYGLITWNGATLTVS